MYEELTTSAEKVLGSDVKHHEEQPPNETKDDQAKTNLTAHSSALLGVIQDIEDDDVFRLDFKLEWDCGGPNSNIVKRTFVLKQTGLWIRWNLGSLAEGY